MHVEWGSVGGGNAAGSALPLRSSEAEWACSMRGVSDSPLRYVSPNAPKKRGCAGDGAARALGVAGVMRT